MATGSISSAGIGSGLDVSSIVAQLVAVESRPLTLLQSQADSMNSRLSTFGKLQSYFSTMQDKANALTTTTLWGGTTASLSNSSAVSVTTSTGATAGSYAIDVSRLAVGQTVSSTAFGASSTAPGAGSLSIELGRYASTPGAEFTAKSGSSAVTINVSADASLADIRDQINNASAGVVAAIITDANGARLSIRSKDTGAENAFRIGATESADDGNVATGLSALSYDASGAGSSVMGRNVSAANAELSINGISISSASNSLSNVIDGLSLNLRQTTTTPVTLDVATDTATIKKAITDFVDAFNTTSSFIKAQTAYNADSRSGGVLQGDRSTMTLQGQLRAVINEGSTASSSWGRLSDIGISMASDGTLKVDDTRLSNAVGSPAELKKLLATDGSGSADSGFARRFKRLADTALGSGGLFENRTSGLKANITRLGNDQTAMQRRIALTETRLRAQYSALDTKMASLTALSSYMTQQITQFNRSG